MFDIGLTAGKSVTIVSKKQALIIDPDQSVKPGDLADRVVLYTSSNDATWPDNVRLVVDGPGEYEVGDFSILGITSAGVATFRIDNAEVAVLYVDDFEAEIDDDVIEQMMPVDIALFRFALPPSESQAKHVFDLVKNIDPKMIVWLADSQPELVQDAVFEKGLGVGPENLEQSDKIKVKSAQSLPATLKVVQLS